MLGGVRTPIGKFDGALQKLRARDIGSHAVRESLSAAGDRHVGVRVLLNAVHQLETPGGRYAVTAICGNGGQGASIALERV